MPLFKCTECGCIDNTACGGDRWMVGADKARCVECVTGKWHDTFPKKTPEESGMVIGDTPYDKEGRFYKSKEQTKYESK